MFKFVWERKKAPPMPANGHGAPVFPSAVVPPRLVAFGFSRVLKSHHFHHFRTHFGIHCLFRRLRVSVFAFGHKFPPFCLHGLFPSPFRMSICCAKGGKSFPECFSIGKKRQPRRFSRVAHQPRRAAKQRSTASMVRRISASVWAVVTNQASYLDGAMQMPSSSSRRKKRANRSPSERCAPS